jgi:hypothetical protein
LRADTAARESEPQTCRERKNGCVPDASPDHD